MSGRRDQRDPRLAAAAEVVIDEGGDLEVDFDEEPTYEPSIDERRELARMLAERARREAAAAKQSLASRAAARPKSAKEALEAARRAEQEKRELARLAAEEAQRAHQRRQEEARRLAREAAQRAREQAEREAREARAAEEQAERDRQAALQPRAATAPNRHPAARERTAPITSPLDALMVEGRVAALLEALGEDVDVVETYPSFQPSVVVPLWKAHAVRARHDGDLTTTLAAEAVHEALQHRPGAVVAAKVAFGGREWAVWLDTSRERVLAALEPAELYLVGC